MKSKHTPVLNTSNCQIILAYYAYYIYKTSKSVYYLPWLISHISKLPRHRVELKIHKASKITQTGNYKFVFFDAKEIQ